MNRERTYQLPSNMVCSDLFIVSYKIIPHRVLFLCRCNKFVFGAISATHLSTNVTLLFSFTSVSIICKCIRIPGYASFIIIIRVISLLLLHYNNYFFPDFRRRHSSRASSDHFIRKKEEQSLNSAEWPIRSMNFHCHRWNGHYPNVPNESDFLPEAFAQHVHGTHFYSVQHRS